MLQQLRCITWTWIRSSPQLSQAAKVLMSGVAAEQSVRRANNIKSVPHLHIEHGLTSSAKIKIQRAVLCNNGGAYKTSRRTSHYTVPPSQGDGVSVSSIRRATMWNLASQTHYYFLSSPAANIVGWLQWIWHDWHRAHLTYRHRSSAKGT